MSQNSKNLLQLGSHFKISEAYQKLSQFLSEPFDLRDPTQLTPKRIENYVASACGYKLLYGTERISDQILDALGELAFQTHALDQMKKMQSGEIVNFVENFPCEKRAALHTATRDLFDHPQTSESAQNAAKLARNEVEKLKKFTEEINQSGHFDQMIMIGIGGSDLGPRANYLALQHLLKKGRKVHFLCNVDPDDSAAILAQVNPKKTLVVTVSKSGTTLETATNEAIVRAYFAKNGVKGNEQFISVTMPKTPMDNSKHYGHIFHLWDWVGGRYSTTSMVGGVALSFAFGFEVFLEFLKGAHAMDQNALEPDFKKNLPLLSALIGIWNRNFLQFPTLAIIPYSQALQRYPAHFQQVDMESNGKLLSKEGKFSDVLTGPVLWGEPGTNAQHSFFQLLHQGMEAVPLLMIGYKSSQYEQDLEVEGTTSQQKLLANLFAQSLALATGKQGDNANQFFPGNRPTTILLGEKLTPFSLGALLSFYENRVDFQGFIWGINSFDQEGVQLGKVVANKIIQRFADKGTGESYPLADAYLKHLDHFQ